MDNDERAKNCIGPGCRKFGTCQNPDNCLRSPNDRTPDVFSKVSDTPRTDAIARHVIHDTDFSEFKTNVDELVPADFARQLERERNNWEKSAASFFEGQGWYRDLIIEIGEMLGEEAYIADDGTKSDTVLCAKVPELVRMRLGLPPKVRTGDGN